MNLRQANKSDLAKLKTMYKKIIDSMNQNNIRIQNEYYPYEVFTSDIDQHQVYLLTEGNKEIIAAFVLCESNEGESYINWQQPHAKALYLERFAVNVDYLRQGMGSLMLQYAIGITKKTD